MLALLEPARISGHSVGGEGPCKVNDIVYYSIEIGINFLLGFVGVGEDNE